MDAQTLGLIATSICSVIAAIAAAFGTIRRSELESLERRVKALEGDIEEERTAHGVTRTALREAQAALQALHERYRAALALLARHGITPPVV